MISQTKHPAAGRKLLRFLLAQYSPSVLLQRQFDPGGDRRHAHGRWRRTQGLEADPNVIPTEALARVEVLADGASSIYGSDAVAGVVNFITRKTYEGLEVNGQAGWGKGYISRTWT